jgi:acetate kinase
MTRVLTVNAGSSSLKLDVIDPDDSVVERVHLADWQGDTEAIARLVEQTDPDVVAHRVVHGGWAAQGPVLIDRDVRVRIQEAGELAPLHQPRALAGIDAARRAAQNLERDLPMVACFDTTFHQTMPPAASTYAVPRSWREEFGVRRFGFHGLSHAYVARRAPELIGRDPDILRVVSCHLGAGASVCAIDAGRSVATSMGMTPAEGLVMATRAGSIDPGILLWLLRTDRLSADELQKDLEHRSGLLGLAGQADMQDLLAADNEDARLAVDVYLHRLASEIASMTAALGGLDVVAFTGGVGENAAPVRAATARRLGYLGMKVDGERNTTATGDARISPDSTTVAVVVVEAREDLEVARQARRLVSG